jgi:hypothetical protein
VTVDAGRLKMIRSNDRFVKERWGRIGTQNVAEYEGWRAERERERRNTRMLDQMGAIDDEGRSNDRYGSRRGGGIDADPV